MATSGGWPATRSTCRLTSAANAPGGRSWSSFFDIAEQAGCIEVCPGTEIDDDPANALYASLDPTERETFVGCAWEIPRD